MMTKREKLGISLLLVMLLAIVFLFLHAYGRVTTTREVFELTLIGKVPMKIIWSIFIIGPIAGICGGIIIIQEQKRNKFEPYDKPMDKKYYKG